MLDFGQHRAESPPALKHYSDLELPANLPDVLTHTGHVVYVSRWYAARVVLVYSTVSALFSYIPDQLASTHGIVGFAYTTTSYCNYSVLYSTE